MCLNPLIHTLEDVLTGIKIERGRTRIASFAYADDVTVFLTLPADVQNLQEALRTYEEATGAKILMQKSRAVAIGGWDASSMILDIPYNTGIKILGFHFTDRVNTANIEHWYSVTSQVRATAQDAWYTDLSLDRRIRFVHDYLLVRIWYAAQIFPITSDSMRKLNTLISWFIWCGEIFRVPLSTLQRGRDIGGWDLVSMWAKCMALFIYRVQAQGRHEGSFTATWLMRWNIQSGAGNPPYLDVIPAVRGHLREYVADVAYIRSRDNTETCKKHLYTTLKALIITDNRHQEMRITKLWPHADWVTIWKNLQAAPVSGLDTATWYKVIHDIIPTNVRLHRITMSPTDTCKDCGGKDTLEHCLTECGEGTTTWGHTKSIIARILRTSAANIPHEWLVRPQFSLWPPQCHRAVLWVLARYVTFRTNHPCHLTQQDLMDLVRRSKWKMYQQTSRSKNIANILSSRYAILTKD